MQKRIEPTGSTINANEWFADYLTEKVNGDKGKAIKLADAIGMERKAIYSYMKGERSPRLEIVAKICAYFGEDEIKIPLKGAFVPCAHCKHWHRIDPLHEVGFCSKHNRGVVAEDTCDRAKAR